LWEKTLNLNRYYCTVESAINEFFSQSLREHHYTYIKKQLVSQ
jgi:hypothetical protein